MQYRPYWVVTLLVGVLGSFARAEQTTDEVFAQIRALQKAGDFDGCAKLGREAAPSLAGMEVVWFIVGECDAARERWCDANDDVNRFLAHAEGASDARIAEAKKLAGDALDRCNALRDRDACVAAHDGGDWTACAAACEPVDAALLPRPKIALLAHCLLELGRCKDAKAGVLDQDLPTLEPGDADRLQRCEEPPPPKPHPSGGAGAGPWLIGIGTAVLVTGIIFLALSDGDAHDLNALAPTPGYDARYDTLADTYRTHAIIGHAGMWGGIVLAGVGLAMTIAGGGDHEGTTNVVPEPVTATPPDASRTSRL